ncbi:MAG: hypothetical protein N2506_05025, partial [Dehalococcoidales bacterium]|nr:hypothetical protein [Dehalococcoidales bacterium]
MIKAVFFDLYYTLVRYEPPREVLEAEALRAVGKNVEASALVKPLLAADEFLYAEIARRPLNERTREEKMDLYVRHQEVLLREAGIPADRRLAMQVLALGQQMKSELVLFDDVLPALGALKAMGLMLGLISNVDRDV